MGASWESELEFVDTGGAPEYFIEGIGKREILPGGIVRSFACRRSGKLLVPQYSYVASVTQLALMARLTLDACAKMHTETQMHDWMWFGKK